MIEPLTEIEIDDLVTAQADDRDAWDEPVQVHRKKVFSLVPSVDVDKDNLNGKAVFEGTVVPVSAFLDSLAQGGSLNEFLNNFPTVKREQAIRILEYFKATLETIKLAA